MRKRHLGSFCHQMSSCKHVLTCYEGPTWPNEHFCQWAIIGDDVKTAYFAQNHHGNMIERSKTVKNDVLLWAIIGEYAKIASKQSCVARKREVHLGSFCHQISSFKHVQTCYEGPKLPNEHFCQWAIIGDVVKTAYFAQNQHGNMVERSKTVKNGVLRWAIIGEHAQNMSK